MELELDYGKRLTFIGESHKPERSGFGRDSGMSLKASYLGVLREMTDEGDNHVAIAQDIKVMIIDPFTKWSAEHRKRVEYSEGILLTNLKVYQNKVKTVKKYKLKYFSKCQALEEIKMNMTDEEIELKIDEIEKFEKTQSLEIVETLGGIKFNKSQLKSLFRRMVDEIPQSSIKLPILGNYDHVSKGSSIVSWLQKNFKEFSIRKCEQFGKELLSKGYIKSVDSSMTTQFLVSNSSIFANSDELQYQWKPSVFKLINEDLETRDNVDNIANYIDEFKNALNLKQSYNSGSTNDNNDNSISQSGNNRNTAQAEKFKKINLEIKELDSIYQKECLKLNKIRCDFEELIIDHFVFMEKCELDRIKALKKIIIDFSFTISNQLNQLKLNLDNFLILHETISPEKDLLYLIENYRTGSYLPKVTLYDNYYNNFKDQIFGVDLEILCKNDNKTIPIVVSNILSFMDSIYPNLENDEERRNIWLVSVKLKETHQLRNKIESCKNKNETNFGDLLNQEYENKPEVVASVLKLYLLELPNSLIPNELYEVIKKIYLNEIEQSERIELIKRIVKNLNRCNFQTLNALVSHFERLISILNENKDEIEQKNNKFFQTDICQEFSNCLLRPNLQSNISLNDKHCFKLLNDLFNFKSEIFKRK